MNEEKRKHPRFYVSQLVNIEFGKETFIDAQGLNISHGGIYCRTNALIEPLTRVFIMLDLNFDGKVLTIRTEGVVVHSAMNNNQCFTGIEFMPLCNEDENVLKDYINFLSEMII